MKASITVFVCGTYADLSAERGAVLDALQRLQLKHQSMEFFGARPERSIETCLAEVRKSDILVVVVGDRYGTLVPGMQISFSEAEYEEARRLNKPCLVYIRQHETTQAAISDTEAGQAQLLNQWKATLRSQHTPATFQNGTDLALQVAVDLGRWITEVETSGQSRTPSHAERAPALQPATWMSVRSSQRFGDESRQILHGLTTDGQGNIIIVGDFRGNIDFGGSRLTSAGDRDIFVAKFDRKGTPLWSKRYGDAAEQVGVGVDTDATGATFIISVFSGTLSFGGDLLVSKGRYNVALAKLDSTGNHLWSYAFGDSQYHVPECIAVTPSGEVIVAGRFQGSIDFGCGNLESTSRQTDIFLAVFSSDGQYCWAKRIGGPFEQQTRSLAIGPDGTIALTGVFKGVLHVDHETLSEQRVEDYCGFLAEFDRLGNVLWCKRFGEPNVEQGSAVAFDRRNGDLIVAGFTRNRLPPGTVEKADSICLFARYDPAGMLRWSKAFGTHAFADSIAVAPDGRILLTGHFQGVIDLGCGPLKSAGGYDIFAATFTDDGNVEWSRRFGDQRHQFLIKGVYGHAGAIILAGSFHGTIDFGTGPLVASGYDGLFHQAPGTVSAHIVAIFPKLAAHPP
jgi:hypothetical protein